MDYLELLQEILQAIQTQQHLKSHEHLECLKSILDSLHSLHQKVNTIMAGTTELDTELTALEAAQAQESTDVAAAFAALEAKIAALPVAADLQPEIDRIKALVTKEQTVSATATPLTV